ncbi:MAG: tyrosine-type recombinase/integrase, partial [Anaerolineales bacterium]|nr:tyrosine-type recombinase/integrase [Anaerolineales bacterium]
MNTKPATPAARYDRSLALARHRRLPAGTSPPQPTHAWPAENVALLAHYRDWLLASGASPYVVDHLYVPVAGHVLGLALKPHPKLDLERDLQRANDYIQAKQLSAEWTDMNRNAVLKFRQYLRQQRGQCAPAFKTPDLTRYQAGLPAWLVEQLTRFQHLRQAGWRPAHRDQAILNFWSHHTRLWRWLFAHRSVRAFSDVKRQHLLDFMDHRLAQGFSPVGVNGDLRNFHSFLFFLQDQGWAVPQALLRLRGLAEPDRLPRFLTDAQVAQVRAGLEARAAAPPRRVQPRDTLLDRAAFYLLWQGGLRLGELEDLRLSDLDLAGRQLLVRQGKGRKDRAVFLADSAISALKAYLAVRGSGPSDHVFLYRAEPVHKDLIHCRIRYAGERAGVKVTAHMLRHTYATQLLNAGCPVTSLQKLLGHQRLNSTQIYARVHDRTVADDYFTAMAQVEK